MKIHTHLKQNTHEWLEARAGVITASEFSSIITPAKLEPCKGKGVDTYVALKVAEQWLGGPLPSSFGGTMEMEAGKIREEEAIPWYEARFDESIDRPAFITDDAGRCGCSPDGLLGEDGGIEIKCPNADTHVKYLLAGEVPTDYLPQIHASMYVTGRRWWKFFSYRRGFPPLILTVNRDEKVMATIAAAVEAIIERIDAGYATILEKNGGKLPGRVRGSMESPELGDDAAPAPVQTLDTSDAQAEPRIGAPILPGETFYPDVAKGFESRQSVASQRDETLREIDALASGEIAYVNRGRPGERRVAVSSIDATNARLVDEADSEMNAPIEPPALTEADVADYNAFKALAEMAGKLSTPPASRAKVMASLSVALSMAKIDRAVDLKPAKRLEWLAAMRDGSWDWLTGKIRDRAAAV